MGIRIAAVALAVLAVGGCTERVDGAQAPEPDRLTSLLADDTVVNQILGTTQVREDIVFPTLWQLPDGRNYEPAECIAVAGNAMEPAYRDSGHREAREAIFSDPAAGYDISQAVVSFDTSAQAVALVARTVSSWRDCAGRTLTISYVDDADRPPGRYLMGPPWVVDGIDVTESHSLRHPGRRDVRAIRAVDNLVVDVRVSGSNVEADQAVRLVNALANRTKL